MITFERLRVERTRNFNFVFSRAQLTATPWNSLETWDIGAGRSFWRMFKYSNADLTMNKR